MNQNPLRRIAEDLNFPNWAAGGLVLAAILLLLAFVLAAGTGATPAERVQMMYQLALVIAGLIGLPLAIWRSWTGHRQAETGQKQLEGLQRQIALAESGAEADRLQKGAELLQADGMAVRTAGIAILREIGASQAHRFQKEAIAVLASFLRSRTKRTDFTKHQSDVDIEDIHFAFRVLVRFKKEGAKFDFGSIAIRGIGIADYDFDEGGFDMAKFAHASFSRCNIGGLDVLSFYDCRFNNCRIFFDIIDLVEYKGCHFSNCKLSGHMSKSDLEKLSMRDCDTSELQISGL
jgi:hypothetical protein